MTAVRPGMNWLTKKAIREGEDAIDRVTALKKEVERLKNLLEELS